jgi:hypothetical protein
MRRSGGVGYVPDNGFLWRHKLLIVRKVVEEELPSWILGLICMYYCMPGPYVFYNLSSWHTYV